MKASDSAITSSSIGTFDTVTLFGDSRTCSSFSTTVQVILRRRLNKLAFLPKPCFKTFMGNWGFLPLENDAALDWNADLFQANQLEGRVKASLELDIQEQPEAVRAAAHLVGVLVSNGIWPDDSKAKFIDLAADRLSQMLAEEVFTNVGFVAAIRSEIRLLHDLSKSQSHDGFQR